MSAKRTGLPRHLDTPRRVVLRDFLLFEIKLVLDGLKGLGISLLAFPAILLDLLNPGDPAGHRFYGVMRLGERLDRWLSLYGAAQDAEGDPDGLFGVSRAGSPTLLGRLESLVNRAVVGRAGEAPADAAKDRPAPSSTEEEPVPGDTGGRGTAAPGRATAKAGDLFDRGLVALDRAVDVIDPPEAREPG